MKISVKRFLLAGIAAAIIAMALVAFVPTVGIASADEGFRSVGRAAYLVDSDSGSVLYAKNELSRYPIASMVKIMTVTLALEAVERGEAGFDDDVTVSLEAASMGGSQVFLQEGDTHKLGDLLRTVIVASANDSCVAIAEHIGGSVSQFVGRMNERAQELNMENTSFKNCTGLPAAESYSCAKDAATMFAQLIKHPKYFEYAKVWMEDYKHPDGRITSIANTNKLVRFYNGCDGGKTGFTNEAKFCLAATAKRGDMRIIAVMMGADSSKVRNSAVSEMFDYAFNNYTNKVLLKCEQPLDRQVDVTGGKSPSLAVTVANNVTAFTKNGEGKDIELRYELPDSVKAPVKRGQVIGRVYAVKNGEILSQSDVIAAEDIKKLSLFDAIAEIGKHWSISAN